MTTVSDYRIIQAAFNAHVYSIRLDSGRVAFAYGPVSPTGPLDWRFVEVDQTDYDLLWSTVCDLKLSDECRATAPQLVPAANRGSWTCRVYLGPNAAGRTNALLDFLRTDCIPDLSLLAAT